MWLKTTTDITTAIKWSWQSKSPLPGTIFKINVKQMLATGGKIIKLLNTEQNLFWKIPKYEGEQNREQKIVAIDLVHYNDKFTMDTMTSNSNELIEWALNPGVPAPATVQRRGVLGRLLDAGGRGHG